MTSQLRRAASHLRRQDPVLSALVLLLVAYYVVSRGIFQGKASGDGYFGFLYLPGIFHHQTIDLATITPYWSRILGTDPHTGHVANACPIGPVAFWIVPYLVGLALQGLAGLVTTLPPSPPGETPFLFWMAGLGSLGAGLAGVVLLFRLLARRLGVAAARFGTTVAVLATPLVWYLVNQPLYQHACAFFTVTLLVERWDAWRGDGRAPLPLRRWAWLGALVGAAMLMRLQEGLWLVLPGLDALGRVLAERRPRALLREAAGVAVMALVALLVFTPQLLVFRYYYGGFHPPQPPGHMRWSDPALVATIFSTRGGMLPWAPSLYLVVPGLLLARRRLGGLALRLGLLLALEVWVNASAWDHWGSWSYGPRRFTDATVTFALGLGGLWAWLADRRLWARGAVLGFATLTVILNGLCMESVRALRMKSSGAIATPAATWIRWAGWPASIGRLFDATGYPFVQPAGWIYALVYRVPPRTFEGVVGNYILERDWRIHGVVHTPGISFLDPLQYVPEGLLPRPPGAPASLGVETTGRVRVLVPLAGKEPLRLRLSGDFGGAGAQVKGSWNGVPLKSAPASPTVVTLEVPEELVTTRARTNQLVLELPPRTRLLRLDFDSLGRWWM